MSDWHKYTTCRIKRTVLHTVQKYMPVLGINKYKRAKVVLLAFTSEHFTFILYLIFSLIVIWILNELEQISRTI